MWNIKIIKTIVYRKKKYFYRISFPRNITFYIWFYTKIAEQILYTSNVANWQEEIPCNPKLHVAERGKSTLKAPRAEDIPQILFPSNFRIQRSDEENQFVLNFPLSRYTFFPFSFPLNSQPWNSSGCAVVIPSFFLLLSGLRNVLKSMSVWKYPISHNRPFSRMSRERPSASTKAKTTGHISRNATCFSKRNDNGYYYLPDRMLACIISYSNMADTCIFTFEWKCRGYFIS